MSPYGVIRPQWIKMSSQGHIELKWYVCLQAMHCICMKIPAEYGIILALLIPDGIKPIDMFKYK